MKVMSVLVPCPPTSGREEEEKMKPKGHFLLFDKEMFQRFTEV